MIPASAGFRRASRSGLKEAVSDRYTMIMKVRSGWVKRQKTERVWGHTTNWECSSDSLSSQKKWLHDDFRRFPRFRLWRFVQGETTLKPVETPWVILVSTKSYHTFRDPDNFNSIVISSDHFLCPWLHPTVHHSIEDWENAYNYHTCMVV